MLNPELRESSPKEFFAANPEEKVVLAVDLDEVCFDYLGGLRKYLKSIGREVPDNQPTSWSLAESGWVSSDQEFKEIHSKAVEEGIYSTLELLPGAHDVLWDLVRSGYEINILTSRFVVNKQHKLVVFQTAKALDFHDLPYSNLMFQKNKTRFLADAYLDDGPLNIEPLRAAGRFVVKVDQEYNKTLERPAASNWYHARNILKTRFGR